MSAANVIVTIAMAGLAVLRLAGDVGANGREVQREIVARVARVDAERGTLVVERELRGTTWRLTLAMNPATAIFDCGPEKATLAALRSGDPVSVYYEPMGREALANLVVVERPDRAP